MVSDLLQGELETRGWAQADLARVLSWPAQAVSELRQGKRSIDAQMAVDLETVTGKSAEEWLLAQAKDDLSVTRGRRGDAQRQQQIAARAQLESLVPTRELIRRGLIDRKDPELQAKQVHELIGDDPTFGASAKRTSNAVEFTRAQRAWIALARRQGQGANVASFNEERFVDLAASLAHTMVAPEDFEQLPGLFAEVGVPLVYVRPFPGGRIDAVSMGVAGRPLIALSGRGKRLDKVFFALLHECAHVASGHWRDAPRVHEAASERIVGDPSAEATVNKLAESWVFPQGIGNVSRPVTNKTITELALKHKVAPAVVVGHLQHKGEIAWSSTLGRGLPNVEGALMKWKK